MTVQDVMRLVERYASARADDEVACIDASQAKMKRTAAAVDAARSGVVAALDALVAATIAAEDARPF